MRALGGAFDTDFEARRRRCSDWVRTALNYLDDAVLLLFAVLLFPVVILLVGSPLALFIWVVLTIADRLLE